MDNSNSRKSPLIGIVGVCASGKTTLIRRLAALGYQCRHIAQEHSYVPSMWLQITNPDFLIYLQVDYAITIQRKRLNWTQAEYDEQLHRLRHAYAHANFIINTSHLTLDDTVSLIIEKLDAAGIKPSPPAV